MNKNYSEKLHFSEKLKKSSNLTVLFNTYLQSLPDSTRSQIHASNSQVLPQETTLQINVRKHLKFI